MDHLVGEDLATRLDVCERLVPEALVDLSRQLCSALEIAHGLGYVHRDIKPTNLFLEEHQGRAHLKVLDFGIAKHFADAGRLTASDVLLGAPAYMAPEQIQNPRDVDARADLWSCAVVLFRCLVGERPFEGTGGGLLASVLTGPHKLATSVAPDLPRSLDAFFDRALAKRPCERFTSAGELHAALLRAL
jgi:serine/threonine-protein kinase